MKGEALNVLRVSILQPGFPDSAKGQDEKGPALSVRLRLSEGNKPYKLRRDPNGFLIENVRTFCSYQYDYKLLSVFNQLLRAHRPRLMHLQVLQGVNVLPILNAASSLGIRKILTLQDDSLFCLSGICRNGRKKCPSDSLLRCDCPADYRAAEASRLSLRNFNQLREVLCERIIQQSDRIICRSSYQRARLVRLFGEPEKFIALSSGDRHEGFGAIDGIWGEVTAKTSKGLFLRLGMACNNRCIFCVTGADRSMESFSFDTVRRILKENRNRYDSLVLTGGEPTLRRDFFDILDFSCKLGYAMMLQTNGRLFAFQRFCKKIFQYNLRFSININGPTAKIHDDITGVPGSFRQTVQGIKNLQESGADILVKVLLTKTNYKYLLRTAQFVATLGVKNIWFVFLTPYGSAGANFDAVVPSFSDVAFPLEQAFRWLRRNTGVKISLEGFPHCRLAPEDHPLITETRFTQDSLDGLIPVGRRPVYNCKRERVSRQKQKFPDCGDCLYDTRCEGVYREYVKQRGRNEFRPVLLRPRGKPESVFY